MPRLELYNNTVNVEEFDIDLNEMDEIYQSYLAAKEECEYAITFKIRVASAAAKMFEIITGDDDSDTSVKTFRGIILHNHRSNAYFAEGIIGNSPPICSSMDAKLGINTETGEQKSCAKCPLNEYGSSSKGKGKACKNMQRMYILVEGYPIPFVFSAPPTSLQSWNRYRMASLSMKKLEPHEVITEFSLEPNNRNSDYPYSIVKFKLIGQVKKAINEITSQLSNLFKVTHPELTGDDYNRLPSVGLGSGNQSAEE